MLEDHDGMAERFIKLAGSCSLLMGDGLPSEISLREWDDAA